MNGWEKSVLFVTPGCCPTGGRRAWNSLNIQSLSFLCCFDVESARGGWSFTFTGTCLLSPARSSARISERPGALSPSSCPSGKHLAGWQGKGTWGGTLLSADAPAPPRESEFAMPCESESVRRSPLPGDNSFPLSVFVSRLTASKGRGFPRERDWFPRALSRCCCNIHQAFGTGKN